MFCEICERPINTDVEPVFSTRVRDENNPLIGKEVNCCRECCYEGLAELNKIVRSDPQLFNVSF